MTEPIEVPGRLRRWGILAILTLLVIPPILFAGWTWVTLHFAYSSGERAGYVQKISQKGWICKTWEGELAMVNLPGAMPEIFNFSVRDDAVARRIEQSIGQRVSLTYDEHRGIPTSCFGETSHFITAVRPVMEATAAPSRPPAVTKP